MNVRRPRSTGCSATRRGCGCCACCARERLNVTELTGILGLAQSGVSRHLGLLKDAGLVAEEKDAGFTYYRLAPALARRRRTEPLWAVLDEQFDRAAGDPAVRADDARLQEVLRLRKENFDTHGGADTRDARQLVPGRSWAAWSRALGLLLPPLTVADLGCGEGYLTIEAARWAARVIAVDRSDVVLERARALAAAPARVERHLEARRAREAADRATQRSTWRCCRRRCTTRETRRAPSPRRRAITVPGGRVLVLDLRDAPGGLGAREARRSAAGIRGRGAEAHADRGRPARRRRSASGARKTGDPFTVLIASGRSRRSAREHESATHSRKHEDDSRTSMSAR